MTAGEAAYAAIQAGAVQKLAELSRLLEIIEARRLERVEELAAGDPETHSTAELEAGGFLAGAPRIRVLEIGSYLGGTLAAWRAMWPDALVFAVDLPDPADRHLEPHGATVIVGDSHLEGTRERLLAVLGDLLGEIIPSVDLLFVDGDHSEEGCRRDVEMYGPLLRPGGLLAMHDVTPYNEGKSAPMGSELVWASLDRWTTGTTRVGAHEELVPVWRRIGAIIDRTPQADGRGPWWGGIGLAEAVAP